MDYYQVTDGEWFAVKKRGFKHQCCDCGLVHTVDFRISAAHAVDVRFVRDARSTATARRQLKKAKKK